MQFIEILKLEILFPPILLITGLWILGNIFTWQLQHFFVFLPKKLPSNFVFKFNAPAEEHFLSTPNGGVINMLWFKSPQGNTSTKGIVLYHHGNKGNLKRWGHYHTLFQQLGYDFAVYDYRGFGKSIGPRSEANMYADARAVFHFLAPSYTDKKVIQYGRSLGSAFAVHLATLPQCDYLILETPLNSLRHLFYTYYPFFPRFFLFKYRFENIEKLKQVPCPILVFHGTNDWVVPLRSAIKIKSSLKKNDRFIILQKGTHHNTFTFPQYQELIREVLQN